MRLPFLDRSEELARLKATFARDQGTLTVLYGRRRCGKSRLLQQALPRRRSVYYVGDDRESSLQRAGLATEIARQLPAFDQVTYPDWDVLLSRWWSEAQGGLILALDEFPSMVSASPELPSLLQKQIDRNRKKGLGLALTGSSQRMMQGLVLDRTAPLFGRAAEIMKIEPLPAGWIEKALRPKDEIAAVEAFSVWGGIPRYWELASDHEDLPTALRSLILSPLGVLHQEPTGLLLDDLRDTAQAASILSLIGRGCHRLSEIAARLEKPATSLSRPVQRLINLDLVRREVPFGASERNNKKTFYKIVDPFLRFWFRFVEPNRSRLEARQIEAVAKEVTHLLPHHTSQTWEELARESVPALRCFDLDWRPACRWWGPSIERTAMEIDIVAESTDGRSLLIGEAKWGGAIDAAEVLARLERKAALFPLTKGRKVYLGVWTPGPAKRARRVRQFSPRQVLRALR